VDESQTDGVAEKASLRVVTWNVWWRFADWQRRGEVIGDVLENVAADVICLQEIWDDGEDNLAGRLARRLGMHWTWAMSSASNLWQTRIGEHSTIGNAVLSRWPIGERAVLHLPTGDAVPEGRTALYCRIDAEVPIPVFTTQLNSHPAHSAVRMAQVMSLAEFVGEHRGGGFPPIVTGDLNAEPDSDEVRRLCGHKTVPAWLDLVLVDAWRYAGAGDEGWTWDRANQHVLKTREPSGRIDYILVGLPTASGGAVCSAARIGDTPVEGVWPSDHAGVAADLEVIAPQFMRSTPGGAGADQYRWRRHPGTTCDG
jgi:endonuclease/exonuclease/phosphatase family metal-dependent hydrolase